MITQEIPDESERKITQTQGSARPTPPPPPPRPVPARKPLEAYDDGYFAKPLQRVQVPVAAPRPATPPRSYGWLTTVGLALVLLAGLWFGYQAMRPAEPGSKEDLSGRIGQLLPSSMTRTKEFYQSEDACSVPNMCPHYVGHYSITGSVGAARDEMIGRLQELGIDFRQNERYPNLLIADEEKYIYFLVFHEAPYAAPFDQDLPPGLDADLSVGLKQPIPGLE